MPVCLSVYLLKKKTPQHPKFSHSVFVAIISTFQQSFCPQISVKHRTSEHRRLTAIRQISLQCYDLNRQGKFLSFVALSRLLKSLVQIYLVES